MKKYEMRCCECGSVNRDLLLEETHGLFECERCGTVILCIPFGAPDGAAGTEDVSFYSLLAAPSARREEHVHRTGTR